jgi:hypothetical protein
MGQPPNEAGMANSLITPDWITKESMRVLTNELKFAGNVNRDYDDQYRQAGAKVGYTVKARLPQRFRTVKGQALVVQSITDTYVPITITDQAQIGIAFGSAEQTMQVDMYRERYIKPAVAQIANTVDLDGLVRCYPEVYNSVGAPGTVPTSNQTYLDAGVLLSNGAAPMDGRVAMLDAKSQAAIANANFAAFNPQKYISEAFRAGQFAGPALAIDSWYMDQNVARHTTGSFTASTPVVSSAGQTGSSLATSGWASGATSLKRGDVFTIAGVYSVNPQSYQANPDLQQFVVTADTTDTTGAATIPISPSIIASGAYQTVSASPALNAAITVVGATSAVGGTLAATGSAQNLVYLPDAFTLVMADLEMPDGGATASRVSSEKFRVSIRFVKQYNINSDQNAARLDIIYGWKTIRPELAARVQGR